MVRDIVPSSIVVLQAERSCGTSRWKSLGLSEGLNPVMVMVFFSSSFFGRKVGLAGRFLHHSPGKYGSELPSSGDSFADFEVLESPSWALMPGAFSLASWVVDSARSTLRTCRVLERHRRWSAVAWASHLGRIIQAVNWEGGTLSRERLVKLRVEAARAWSWRYFYELQPHTNARMFLVHESARIPLSSNPL